MTNILRHLSRSESTDDIFNSLLVVTESKAIWCWDSIMSF